MSDKERNDDKKGENKDKPGHGNRAEGEGSPKGKRILLRTFGCQMNMRDSELITSMLLEKGYEVTDDEKEADLILFNTCSVRQHAEDRVIGAVQKLKARKKKEPDLRIGIVGCMAERHKDMLFEEYPQVDIVVGPNNIYDIPDLIEKTVGARHAVPLLAVGKGKREARKEGAYSVRNGKFSAFVNILYGCNNFCSYCIVPHVRGREVSRPKNDIIDEIKGLVDRGYKEVTLLGQNVNSYGRSLTNKITFPELLEDVNGIDGLDRIRFTTSHPKDAEKSLFRAIKELDKVCEHLHLPLQAGSDKILDLMNRKYKYDDYRKKIMLLKEMVPEAGISTDIIVGFPSEKAEDFDLTYKAMEEIKYNSAFIFKYSPRPPAVSSDLIDNVTDGMKRRRNSELLFLQKNISLELNKAMIGTRQEVLVEGKSRMSDEELIGRTRNNAPCVFPGGEDLVGSIVQVEIKGTSPTTLKGERVTKEEG